MLVSKSREVYVHTPSVKRRLGVYKKKSTVERLVGWYMQAINCRMPVGITRREIYTVVDKVTVTPLQSYITIYFLE
jgi:hypothetical protein